MIINLNKLNESLEAKYLNESTLTEKFSDMPEWLSKRILSTKYQRNDGQSRNVETSRGMGIKSDKNGWVNRDKIDKKNPNFGPRPTYGNPRGNDKYADKSLYSKLLSKGINLDTVKVVEGPKPEKRTDERLKEPNIPIFLFSNGQVYAKGVNDDEEYSGDGAYKPFKYLPVKTLIGDEVEKFAYIDGNDDSNFQANVKHSERVNQKNELNNIPNYNRDKKKAGYSSHWAGTGKWDKSGYKVLPPAEKYRDKLAEIKCSKIYSVLDETYDLLVETKEELSNILLNADIKDSSGDSDYSRSFNGNSSSMMELFKAASHNYRQCIDFIDRITNDERLDEAKKKEKIMDFINYDYNYSELMKQTKEIKKLAPSLFNAVIDWI